MTVAEKLVKADRIWVVTGTPLKDLVGVEIDLATNHDQTTDLDPSTARETMLAQRKRFSLQDDQKAVQSLGNIVTHFLKLRPWARSDTERSVEWNDYVYRHESRQRHTHSGFSRCLRSTVEGIVIKTRPKDVERDIVLPPFQHRVVRLEPSFYDRLTANLFTLVITSNAVTSERTDVDYLFHKNSSQARYALVQNLRHSNFFWTAFSEADIRAALKRGQGYLEKERPNCTLEDRLLLTECIEKGQVALISSGWKALSKSHEIGLFVDGWPGDSVASWVLGEPGAPLLVGATPLLHAQTHVNSRLSREHPTEDLAEVGRAAMGQLSWETEPETEGGNSDSALLRLTKTGVPKSSVDAEPSVGKRRRTSSGNTPSKRQKRGSVKSIKNAEAAEEPPLMAFLTPVKGNPAIENGVDLPSDSPLRETKLIGTASSKLSYLIDKVMAHHKEEKMLIFYDGDNAAYYIAQALELLDVKHHIYARTLSNDLRSKYIFEFNHDNSVRVLLMDIKCGALGLNLNAASRVIFINPVCRPYIEAQAIKRAHRIGQTRPVEVETLVLKGTIEEAIFERAKAMTREEHIDAAKALEDDQGVAKIIQQARPIDVNPEDARGYAQVTLLQTPQQLFGRPGRGTGQI